MPACARPRVLIHRDQTVGTGSWYAVLDRSSWCTSSYAIRNRMPTKIGVADLAGQLGRSSGSRSGCRRVDHSDARATPVVTKGTFRIDGGLLDSAILLREVHALAR